MDVVICRDRHLDSLNSTPDVVEGRVVCFSTDDPWSVAEIDALELQPGDVVAYWPGCEEGVYYDTLLLSIQVAMIEQILVNLKFQRLQEWIERRERLREGL